MQNSIIFTSAYKDIGRAKWSQYSRSNEQYIEYFLKLARNITYKLVVYIENDMLDILLRHNLDSNIVFIPYDSVETFYKEYIENESSMINSEQFVKKCRPDRRASNPECWNAEYNLVNHSKINFVRHTKELFPGYKYYSWIDFGCIRNTVHDVPNNINFSKLHEKIHYLALKIPTSYISAEEMLKLDNVYLMGSQFIVHTNLVETFEKLYRDILDNWKADIICDDDQSAILQIYFKYPGLFELFKSKEWFSLFKSFLNSNIAINNRNDIHKLINNINNHGRYIEIGVARGLYTKYILANTMLTELLLVDPYKNFTFDEYTDAMNYYDMDAEFEICKKNLEMYNNRIKFIRKTSVDAAAEINDNSVDFVYIDGNHEYNACLNDIKNYWPKIKSGGILFGADVYEYSENKNVLKCWDGQQINNSRSFGVYGVHAALVDFCKEYRLKYFIFSNQFMIYKP